MTKPNEKLGNSTPLSRRTFLWTLSLLAPAAGLAALSGQSLRSLAQSATATPGVTGTPVVLECIATPAVTEGPYFVDEMLNRSDIRPDPTDGSVMEGVPLRLEIGVYQVNGAVCGPLADAQVDIWHTNALGEYSDVEENVGKKFLRGYQLTDAEGVAVFQTIYPGWYRGRAVHIHMKVRTFDANKTQTYEFTSQLFFDDEMTAEVYAANAPYSARGVQDMLNADDGIYTGEGTGIVDADDVGELLLLKLEEDTEAGGFMARFNIGVDLSQPNNGTAQSSGGLGRGGRP